ncbi:MAG: hypothetical protein WCG37_09650 [Actinomycetes bacterium]
MQIKSRIAGSAMALALALGMSAAPAFAAGPAVTPPVAATGDTVYPQGTQVSRGYCVGLLIGSLSNPLKNGGLTNLNDNITSSAKGAYQNAAQAAAGQVGACLVDGRIGVTGLAGGVGGAKYVTKSATKLHSDATSCNSDSNANGIPREAATFVTKQVPSGLSVANGGTVVTTTAAVGGDFQPATRALTGKFSYTFSDLTKSDAYIRVQGFDGNGATIIWLTGIVAKGEFVGSTIGGNVWFNPVQKDSTATTYFDQAVPITTSPLHNTISYAMGYAGGGVLAGGAADLALGCLTGAPMGAGITAVAIGGGSTDPLLGMVSSGVHFLL